MKSLHPMTLLVLLSLALLLIPIDVQGFVRDSKVADIRTTRREQQKIKPSFSSPVKPATTSLGLAVDPVSLEVSSSLSQQAAVSSFLQQAGSIIDPLLLQHIIVGGTLALAGDVIAQSLLSEDETKSFPPTYWDKVRTAAFVTFGALYTGGAQHFIFHYLNAEFDEPLLRLSLAQFGFIPFCYYPTFLLVVPTIRAGLEYGFGTDDASYRQKELFTDVAGKIPTTLVRNWGFWLPVQFIQFNFIPTDYQVTYAAAFGVLWNAILSWSTASSTSTSTDNVEFKSEKTA